MLNGVQTTALGGAAIFIASGGAVEAANSYLGGYGVTTSTGNLVITSCFLNSTSSEAFLLEPGSNVNVSFSTILGTGLGNSQASTWVIGDNHIVSTAGNVAVLNDGFTNVSNNVINGGAASVCWQLGGNASLSVHGNTYSGVTGDISLDGGSTTISEATAVSNGYTSNTTRLNVVHGT